MPTDTLILARERCFEASTSCKYHRDSCLNATNWKLWTSLPLYSVRWPLKILKFAKHYKSNLATATDCGGYTKWKRETNVSCKNGVFVPVRLRKKYLAVCVTNKITCGNQAVHGCCKSVTSIETSSTSSPNISAGNNPSNIKKDEEFVLLSKYTPEWQYVYNV